MNLVEAVARLEEPVDLHLARLVILLNAFADDSHDSPIEGLTKLAKLDFLLRYPVMLERALEAKKQSTRGIGLEEHERQSVESKMVRYRFGPWDHRYREFLNLLVAKGLATVSVEGRKVNIAPTPSGREVANRLAEQVLFTAYTERAQILKRHFDMTATNLMRFIYDTFPEVVSLRSNAQIPT
jgi:hypothetical protein